MRDINKIAAVLPKAEVRDGALVIQASEAVEVLAAVKALGGFALFDITCVDRPAGTPPASAEGAVPAYPACFELAWRIWDLSEGSKDILTIRSFIDHDRAEAPSVMAVWKSADMLEREVWDLMGIRFTGRPHLERVLNRADFEGHPLRKDFVMPKRDRFPPASWDKKAAEGGQ